MSVAISGLCEIPAEKPLVKGRGDMRLSALEHLVEVIRALAQGKRICAHGSGALPGSFREFGRLSGPLEEKAIVSVYQRMCKASA